MREIIINALYDAINNIFKDFNNFSDDFQISLEGTKNKKYGDLSSNIAFSLAKKFNRDPIHIANKIIAKLEIE